ncbi:hypothetical protein BDZ89DRAFT_977529, partial [Hymenopellis radicata]
MSTGLHSLATIIKRLEAATSRIEDLAAGGVFPAAGAPTGAGAPETAAPLSQSAAPSPGAAETPRSVVAFDEAVIDGKLKPFIELTKSFAGANVIEIVGLLEKQYKDMRGLLIMSAACRKPDSKEIEALMSPFSADVEAISRLKEANRKDRDWYTHLTVIAEGAIVVGWVIQPKPGPAINEIKDTVMFYGNRVMKESKDKDPKHAEWVKAYAALLEEMRKYVMEHHTTGLAWNPKGINVSEYKASGSSSVAGAPPPPPPPPPPAPMAPPPPPAAAAPAAGGTAAVFAELNRGADVTKGLRKVDKSEMTHKNPSLRAGSTVPSTIGSDKPGKKPLRPSKPQSLMGKKPAKLALEGKNWSVEYQEDEKSLIIENCELHQAVNIFGCKNSVIQIKGKVNAVTLVNCTKTSIVVESVVSSISVTKSPSFELQVTGTAPIIQIDSTDSGQVYLSKASLGVEVTTAKCSSINVSLPIGTDDQPDYQEQAVPEMLRTVVKDGKLVTSIVEHVG